MGMLCRHLGSSGLPEGFLEVADAWAELGTVRVSLVETGKGAPGQGNSMGKAQRHATVQPI